ncbi:hypothetical protein JD292_06470 [Leucobacter sp. CSA2]|uniref:Uncharacterized protein n=1 Tax=Leucobacter edaphi TaxID=2796472 RepID=A0A934UX71_9MICO|nr:hypothetical protein [Leucobacter edaphi]MBK0421715.1 hypothetical protein [Leucobacter edaphi]
MIITEINSSISSRLSDTFRSFRDQIRRSLGRLDGEETFAYSIYFVPDDAGWPDAPGYDDDLYNDFYLQSAGTAEAMVIELKRKDIDGETRQYAVGRPAPADQSDMVEVHYADSTLTVPPSEVFTADEATDIYYQYFQNQTIPEDLTLRELDLS